MKKSICCSLLVFGLVGCANNSALGVFKKDELFEKALVYTKKGDIINSLETKAIINATYLNPIDKEFKNNKKENFLVGIYIVDDENKDDKKFLKNPNYLLTMNDKNATEIFELNSTHKMYNHLPLKNTWAKYYVVSFDKNESSKNLDIQYAHKTLGSVKIRFDAD